jgi:predicted nucleic acid-binding protein
LNFGVFAWESRRAAKRSRSLAALGALVPVIPFNRDHAERAAELSAQLRLQQIGIADSQIAATALMDGAELLTYNTEHFGRVPGLKLAKL